MANPYSELPDHHFWRRSIASQEKFSVDPVVGVKFKISSNDKVATAGSCFAQHISNALISNGFNFFVTEKGEHLVPEQRRARNYGVYSARYGNIYTVRHLKQLLDEALHGRQSNEQIWRRDDGRFVDPYRPTIEPDGFESEAALVDSRAVLMERFRELVREADVFVFTLGLTEGWRSKRDGSVFPIVPGAAGGSFENEHHEFVNFPVSSVLADLADSFDEIRKLNPKIKVLLTVSPVPLIATFEDRHVLVSNAYSKSVLRVAAEEFARDRDWVQYFPSYEIITGSFNLGSYFESDFREVNAEGIAHVMRVVRRHLLDQNDDGVSPPSMSQQHETELICDEEVIDQIRT